MAQPFGVSFQPGVDQQQGAASGPAGQREATPLQSAVKLLSLRLPTVLGAQAPAPAQLMQSGGSRESPVGASSASALNFLRQLFSGQNPQAPPMSTRPTMPAGPSTQPEQPPVFTGTVDTPPMQNAPPGAQDPIAQLIAALLGQSKGLTDKPIYGDRYAYEGGGAPTGSFLSNPQQAPQPPMFPGIKFTDGDLTGGGGNA